VPPVAVNDSATTPHHTPVDIDVTANDSDNDGDGLVFPVTFLDQPGDANISLKPDGHTVHYVPNNQAQGGYVFHYQVCDARGACSTAVVSVVVG
jgi:hypothetical protein